MPIRVIGYFPTVRVTNNETVKIRKVGYQGPAGRPASDFNFSELANVADGAAPTLGRIPWGDGTLWQSVALTAALAGADPEGSAATAQAAAQAFATAADVTVLSTANSTAQGYANTAQTNAATRSDNASNLSTGTVPLPRLTGITNTQLSATAGILSSQIAGLDASKITGTFPLSLMNQGTTGQFLRGDGTYSNTLTGGLTIAGALAGATTGAFSGNLQSTGLTITTSGTVILGNSGSTNGSSNSITGQSNGIAISPVSGSSLFLCNAGAVKAQLTGTLLSMAVPISMAGNAVNYGAAGTTTPANNEWVGTSTGPKGNSASGSYTELLNGGVICAQFGRGGLVAGSRRFNLGGWASAGTYESSLSGIDATTNVIQVHGGTGGQIIASIASGGSTLRLGYTIGTSNDLAWAIGAHGAASTTGTSNQAGWSSPGNGSMVGNVANLGSIALRANDTLRRSLTHVGGVIIADLGAPVVLANSTTTTLMTATNRYGWLRIVDNTGQYAVIRISNTATPVIESSSANFAITASPTASQLGINLSAGTLSIITGSAAGTTISASFKGQ